jgi:SAM-dependent methyltransferase
MLRDLPFNQHVQEYEAWFEHHPYVFESELATIRQAWPEGKDLLTLEIGAASGRFSKALGITEALEPAHHMCEAAEARGVNTLTGFAEDMPYGELQFDVVLMVSCIHYLQDPAKAFKEIYRVLKYNGVLIAGFIDRDSLIGKYYQQERKESLFYKAARFYSVHEIREKIVNAGFSKLEFSQTFFGTLDEIKSVEEAKPGYGQGSYILVKATK